MIRANCRARFTAAYFDFIVRTLAPSQTDQVSLVDLLSDVETRDSILYHPRLVDAILNHWGTSGFRLNFIFTFWPATFCSGAESATGNFVITSRRCLKHFRARAGCGARHRGLILLGEQYISDMLIALSARRPNRHSCYARTSAITRFSSVAFFTRTHSDAACAADRISNFMSKSAGRTINLLRHIPPHAAANWMMSSKDWPVDFAMYASR